MPFHGEIDYFRQGREQQEIKAANQYPHIRLFNELWLEKKIVTPIILMVGGYAGTGKSTLIEGIKHHVHYLSSYATGFARAAAQAFIPRTLNPALYESTFKLHQLCADPTDPNQIWGKFLEQRAPIEQVLMNCGLFIAGEHQHTVIDGNHVSPALAEKISKQCGSISVDLYLKVANPSTHFQMMCGPTHNRSLTETEFRTARILHERIIEEALAANKPVFEWTESLPGALSVIDERLKNKITMCSSF